MLNTFRVPLMLWLITCLVPPKPPWNGRMARVSLWCVVWLVVLCPAVLLGLLTMTHIWRWLALVGVGLALELGSAALVTNADVTAHLVASKYVHLHLIKHCGHLFDATVCLLSTTE